jgi:hypothetical protein
MLVVLTISPALMPAKQCDRGNASCERNWERKLAEARSPYRNG